MTSSKEWALNNQDKKLVSLYLKRGIRTLTIREHKLMGLRFDKDGNRKHTLKEVTRLGIDRLEGDKKIPLCLPRIRQIQNKALRKLRRYSQAEVAPVICPPAE